MPLQGKRRIGKILGIIGICAGVAAGGIGVSSAPSWLRIVVESEAGTPQRTEAGLASAVVKVVEPGITPVDGAYEATAVIFPRNGSSMGSGQPIEITFSEPVADKAAMERAVKISVSSGQDVAWRWYSDQKVRIRPEKFWASGTAITVEIGNANIKASFTTGPQRIAVVDDNAKTMSVYIDGALVKTAPVTLGSADWLSPTGYAVIMEQERYSQFNAGSIGLKPGDKGYYEPLVVEHANRLTNSGVYVHQALPSAYGAVGSFNVSHGCVGLLPADAAWFFNTMETGDLVQVLNTGAPVVEPLEGFGDWNIAWADYAKR